MRRFVVTLAAILAANAGDAEAPKPFPDFTFKRVGVPKSGVGKRITVQIDPTAPTPDAPDPAPKDPTADGPKAPKDLAFAWYWDGISPELADANAGRLEKAVRHLNEAPAGQGVQFPRLQALQEIAAAHGSDILAATIGTEVSPALALAVIMVESSGRTDAVSGAGAAGLMQLMPATAERFGVTDRSLPAENIKGGVAYLNVLMKLFDRDPAMVLAAYNAGENAVKSHEGVPPYDETRAYVPKVLAAWSVAKGLCLTPPQLLSDGCVFAGQGARADG